MAVNIDFGKVSNNRFEGLNKARGPLASLEDTSTANRLIFPSNINEIEHWMVFRVSNKYKFRRKVLPTDETLLYIYLPIPQQLQTGYGANYANESLGPVGELAGQAAAGYFTGDGFSTGTGGITSGGFLKNVAIGAAQSEGATLVSTLIGGSIGGTLGGLAAAGGSVAAQTGIQGALAGLGIQRNPHQALLFSGVDFRSHQFSFKFMPRNQQESEQLTALITAFKYYMSPQITNDGHMFDYPNTFDIDFHYPEHLFDIGESVLTQFAVNYHGEGTPTYFEGSNAPTSVELSMTFQEITITTKDEIAKLGR